MNIQDWNAKDILLLALVGFTLFYLVALVAGIWRAKRENRDDVNPTVATTLTGFVVNFFDTLGIGSFATTTAIVRHWRLVKDEVIPGTLNVGHTPASVAEAVIFTALVPVESITLISMNAAAVAGAWGRRGCRRVAEEKSPDRHGLCAIDCRRPDAHDAAQAVSRWW